jgi:molybdate transport system substrate-binding protein
MNKIFFIRLLTGLSIVICSAFAAFSTAANAEQKVTVFAAASLTNAIGEVSAQYEKEKGLKVANSFAASSALAKQIENGAPADVFISADTKWMNYLQDKNKIDTQSRRDLLGNHLVLIAPKGQSFKVQFDKSFDFSKAFDGRLCTGDLESVPVGIYAKQSLIALKWWEAIKNRIVGTQDVRAALVFVERGECAAGIVYETDAKISSKSETVGTFPDASHDPIVYPVAAVAGGQGKDFVEYLASPQASAIFTKYGFSVIGH